MAEEHFFAKMRYRKLKIKMQITQNDQTDLGDQTD